MKLDTFLLADAAAAADRKIFVHGGGISRIDAPEFPFLQTQIALLVRFACEEGESAEDQHVFGMRIAKPDGSGLYPKVEIPVNADKKERVEGEEIHLTLAVQAGPVQFDVPGVYSVEIFLDGELVRSAALPVILDETPNPNRKTVVVDDPAAG